MTPTAESGDRSTDELLIADHDRRQRKKRRTQVVVGVAVVAAVGAGVGAWSTTWGGGSASANTTAAGLTTTTEVVAAKTANMETTVSASGTLQPADEADLSFAVSGEVTSVKVTAGESVKAGQVLATVSTTALSEAVSAARETLTSDEAALTTAQDDDAAASAIDQAEATVATDKTDLADARADLSDATLESTITGEVSTVGLAVGDEVTGSSGANSSSTDASTGSASSDSTGATGSTGGSTGATGSAGTSGSTTGSSSDGIDIVSTGRFTVSAEVDDTEVGSVKVGDAVVVTPAESSSTVDGKVTSVGLVASDSEGVAAFPVVISVTGRHDDLYAGATATVSIVVKELKHVVEIPTAAISYTGGNATVIVSDNGQQATKTITTGSTLDAETQVTGGLVAGQKVVERVVTFKGGGGGRSLFGGSSSGGRPGGFSGGSFPGGGRSGGGSAGGGPNG